MKLKTSELQGSALDWAVNQIEECCDDPHIPLFSTSWAQAGPIIEREGINLRALSGALWEAETWSAEGGQYLLDGPTPLIAAMRCYVASQLGDEVEVPDELMEYEDPNDYVGMGWVDSRGRP